MNGGTVTFAVAAILALGAALAVIWSRSPVYSVIFLILNFFATAVLFLLLGAEFLAAVQILVYAGAIMVLFLFVIMLLNLRRVEHWRRSALAYGGYLLALAVAFELVWRLARGASAAVPARPGPAPVGGIQEIGQLLYTKYLFLFEATSVLLFVAVIGAVVLAKQTGPAVARRARGGVARAEAPAAARTEDRAEERV